MRYSYINLSESVNFLSKENLLFSLTCLNLASGVLVPYIILVK